MFASQFPTRHDYQYDQNLLIHNAKVYLATRVEQKARKCIEELKEQTGGKEALFIKLDLADLKSVRKAADEFLEYVSKESPYQRASERN